MKSMKFNPYLGKEYTKEIIKQSIERFGITEYEYTDKYLKKAAKLIADGNIIGWFQGRSEIGPRALGHRSILADPRRKEMKDIINKKVKFREEFRPFAPAVLWEYQTEYFDLDIPNQYMLMACNVHKSKRNVIPAVTHIDGTARVQSVMYDVVPIFHNLIREFYDITKVPIILNTSFNIKGEPIVETPDDAIRCFLGTGLDCLVIDRFILVKHNNHENNKQH